MTCIVGLVAEGRVYIGADSAGVAGYDLTVRLDKKVFKNGDFVFGFTTSFRMGQLLQYKLLIPKREEKDLMVFMCTDFIDAVRDCLKSGGLAKKNNEAESAGTFLVGYGNRLFRIEDDYQVAESSSGYAACGCGNNIAIGSLYSTQGKSPEERLLLALKAAESHSAGVRGPFNFENT